MGTKFFSSFVSARMMQTFWISIFVRFSPLSILTLFYCSTFKHLFWTLYSVSLLYRIHHNHIRACKSSTSILTPSLTFSCFFLYPPSFLLSIYRCKYPYHLPDSVLSSPPLSFYYLSLYILTKYPPSIDRKKDKSLSPSLSLFSIPTSSLFFSLFSS